MNARLVLCKCHAIASVMLALALAFAGHVQAQDLVFLSAEKAGAFLGKEDGFIARMSAFDRAARMKTDRDVPVSEYLAFAAGDARDWSAGEKRRLNSAYARIRPAVFELALPLGREIFLIKTSGAESAHAAYTRGSAIVLPEPVFGISDRSLEVLLAHELFHLATRAHPELAERLYRTIGFERCKAVALPQGLSQSLITNPDQPETPYCIEVAVETDLAWVMPILLPKFPFYDPAQGGEYIDYVDFRLLVPGSPTGEGAPRFVKVGEVSGYFEQVGENTQYVIHPEEILAENFAILATGTGVVHSPEILERLQSELAGSRESRMDER
jgi:hypothetical protein